MYKQACQRLDRINQHLINPKPRYTTAEVSKHNTPNDCWIIINNKVIDATQFLSDHPGGERSILFYAGKDASKEFNRIHMPNVIFQYAPKSILGTIEVD
ncbi:cytochrome b5-like heme/steroid binding domain-containing protein [Blakeslea trispora]|nr:cytochrome b5-like heme/steroid binding domain-containing protein [Blakeslea trispora]